MTHPSAPAGLGSLRVAHVGLVVRDIESRVSSWAQVLGLAAPGVSLTPPQQVSRLRYRGSPSGARARQAVLRMPEFAVELLEPVGDGPSTWHDFLRERGEGLHHLAFIAGDDISRYEAELTALRCPALQGGEWPVDPAPVPGRYLYLDSGAVLGATLELLSLGKPDLDPA